MLDAIEALIPPTVMAVLFVVLLVTAFRATDGARRRTTSEDEPASDGPASDGQSDRRE